MKTYFASPERAAEQELAAAVAFASKNPIISGLLSSVGGLLAVLDEHRQIVALNDEFLQMLGVADPAAVLGLRPGEALHCIHAHEEPGGCGTSKFCSSCGAAIAIVSSLAEDAPKERLCALSAMPGDKVMDAALLVRARPFHIEGQRFLLLFVQDVTKQEQRAALERSFFYDINNMLGLLAGTAELLAQDGGQHPGLSETLHRTSMRLAKEVAVHRCLLQEQGEIIQPMLTDVSVQAVCDELRSFFASHIVVCQQKITFPEQVPELVLRTDPSLLLRVLCTMITNALEASIAGPEKQVRVWLEQTADQLVFCVWNAQVIPPETACRIYQLYFSTKGEPGRGIGTYSMKLIGEKILGGKVSFSSSEAEGTVFRFAVPKMSAGGIIV
ncbi:histidine kinase [Candidatus Electronema halotolerans]